MQYREISGEIMRYRMKSGAIDKRPTLAGDFFQQAAKTIGYCIANNRGIIEISNHPHLNCEHLTGNLTVTLRL